MRLNWVSPCQTLTLPPHDFVGPLESDVSSPVGTLREQVAVVHGDAVSQSGTANRRVCSQQREPPVVVALLAAVAGLCCTDLSEVPRIWTQTAPELVECSQT